MSTTMYSDSFPNENTYQARAYQEKAVNEAIEHYKTNPKVIFMYNSDYYKFTLIPQEDEKYIVFRMIREDYTFGFLFRLNDKVVPEITETENITIVETDKIQLNFTYQGNFYPLDFDIKITSYELLQLVAQAILQVSQVSYDQLTKIKLINKTNDVIKTMDIYTDKYLSELVDLNDENDRQIMVDMI